MFREFRRLPKTARLEFPDFGLKTCRAAAETPFTGILRFKILPVYEKPFPGQKSIFPFPGQLLPVGKLP